MGTYIGTRTSDTITHELVSAGVVADPAGSQPSEGADTINGLGGDDTLGGGPGGDTINGGPGNDTVFDTGYGFDAGSSPESNENNGYNVVHGNAGDDVIEVEVTGGADIGGSDVTNRLYGDVGNDTLTVTYGLVCGVVGDTDCPGGRNSGALYLYGGAGDDALAVNSPYQWLGTAGNVYAGTVPTYMYGGPGNDTIQGTKEDFEGDGSYRGGSGVLYGGPGDDTFTVFSWSDEKVIEKAGEGFDTLTVEGYGTYALAKNSHVERLEFWFSSHAGDGFVGSGNNLDNHITGSHGNDVLSGLGGNDTIYGGGSYSGDTIHGNGGDDVIHGGDSDIHSINGVDISYGDLLYGGAGNDTLFGEGGGDRMYGGIGDDTLGGQQGDDVMYGGAGNDTMGGGIGDDRMYGGDGMDMLGGREGLDKLTGGAGSDRFDYNAIVESLPGAENRDAILDFEGVGPGPGDRIDLSDIDADTTQAGNQAFKFVGTAAELNAGELRVVPHSARHKLVQGEVDGTEGIDFEIRVIAGQAPADAWAPEDFIL